MNNISLSYQLSSNQATECLLFLHGLQSKKEIFDPLKQLLSQSFSIPQLSVDFIGFGSSDKPEDFSYCLEDQERAVHDLLMQLNIKRVHIIGHSFGGMVGTLMLETLSNVAASLISLEGNLQLADCGESRKVDQLSFDKFSTSYYPAFKNKLSQSEEPSAVVRARSLAEIPDYVFYKTSKSIVEWSKSAKLFELFNKSAQPKLMICGSKSSFHSRTTTAETVEIYNAGHFMLIDNLDETYKAVSQFMQKLGVS